MFQQSRYSVAVLVGALAPALLVLTGCGHGGGGYPVEGLVTFDGKPLDSATIAFVPLTASSAEVAIPKPHGTIQSGHYAFDAASGPLPGQYKVIISWRKKTGRMVPSMDLPNRVEEIVEMIPKNYNDDTQLRAEIKAERNTINFTLMPSARTAGLR